MSNNSPWIDDTADRKVSWTKDSPEDTTDPEPDKDSGQPDTITEETDEQNDEETGFDPIDERSSSRPNIKEHNTTPDRSQSQTQDPAIKETDSYPDADGYIELGITQVNYTDRELPNGNERSTIHIFGRTPDEKRKFVRVDIPDFDPHFHIPTRETNKLNTDNPEVLSTEPGYESIRGHKLTKVETGTASAVGYLRNDFSTHFEADVLFPDRFLVDNGIKKGIKVPARWEDNHTITVSVNEIEPADVSTEPRVHTADIEVDDRHGFPEPEDAEEPVISISAHDSKQDKYTTWLLKNEDVNDLPDEIEDYDYLDDSTESIEIRKFESEVELLDNYTTYLSSTNPDVLTGWNFEDFDAPYLANRMDNIGDDEIDSDDLSRIDETWPDNWRGPNIKGRVVFDLLEAYKRTQFSELDSYRLEAIGQEELNAGKMHYDGKLGDLWQQDPESLLTYNVRDVEICVELDRKQAIIDFWSEVKEFVGCRLQDAPIPGDAVDMYVLHKANGRFVLPSKGEAETSGEEYEGGAVFDPFTGIEENVTVLDLKSLYPMCMRTGNISPETKVSDTYEGETFTTPTGIEYRKDEDGIVRDMVTELLSEREKKKELRNQEPEGSDAYDLYDQQQAAVKVIMNSLYGTLGWERFRLYDKDNAASVTAVGRNVIEFTEQIVEELGYSVIYGDTDSVMLSLGPDVSKSEAIEQSFEIEETINNRYDEFAKRELNADDHHFQIEFEKLYKRFLQAGKKKRYAGNIIWKEGKDVDKIDITGFEYKRSDIAAITKKAQKNLIEQAVKGASEKEIREYMESVIDDFKNGKVPIEDIGIPSGIGKELDDYKTETAHVRGAIYSNMLLGTNFGKGSKPMRIYLSRVNPGFFKRIEEEKGLNPANHDYYAEFKRNPDVIDFIREDQIPDEFEPDWDKMLEKTLRDPIGRVLKATNLTWEDVMSGQKQTGLGSYM